MGMPRRSFSSRVRWLFATNSSNAAEENDAKKNDSENDKILGTYSKSKGENM